MIKNSLFVSIAISLASFLFFPVGSVFAAEEGEGISISPPINEITIKAGESTDQVLKVTNPTKKIIEVYPTTMNFRASGDGGEPSFFSADEEEAKFSVAHWVSFSQNKVALAPNQVVDFTYTITVPADAESGGHYGAIFLATQPPKPEDGQSQVSIGSMIGSLLLIKVPGPTIEKGFLERYSAPKILFSPPVKFQTRLSNLGNVHFKPKGEITIKNFSGEVEAKLAFNETAGNVLPDSTRRFENKWEKNSAFFAVPFGRYTADLRVVYGNDEKTLNEEIIFLDCAVLAHLDSCSDIDCCVDSINPRGQKKTLQILLKILCLD